LQPNWLLHPLAAAASLAAKIMPWLQQLLRILAVAARLHNNSA
jgi:hypothetical protein